MEINVLKGELAGFEKADHEHAHYPEGEDIVAGFHDSGGVKTLEVASLGVHEGGEGPLGGGKPSVEGVGFLEVMGGGWLEGDFVGGGEGGGEGLEAGLDFLEAVGGEEVGNGAGDFIFSFVDENNGYIGIFAGVIPNGLADAPNDLAGDVPVAQIDEPMA